MDNFVKIFFCIDMIMYFFLFLVQFGYMSTYFQFTDSFPCHLYSATKSFQWFFFFLVNFVTVSFSSKISIWFLLIYYFPAENFEVSIQECSHFWKHFYNIYFIISTFVSSWGIACFLFPYELLQFSWFLYFVQFCIISCAFWMRSLGPDQGWVWHYIHNFMRWLSWVFFSVTTLTHSSSQGPLLFLVFWLKYQGFRFSSLVHT